jgi:ankyrin repeat protein
MLEGGTVEKLQSLALSGEDLIDCDEDGSNLLHHASVSDDPTVIKCLLYMGCDINKKNNVGETPLHIASKFGNLKSLKILLEHKKDWREKDKFGKTFIGCAKEGYKGKVILQALLSFFTRLF